MKGYGSCFARARDLGRSLPWSAIRSLNEIAGIEPGDSKRIRQSALLPGIFIV